jgi:hypothetical protein
MPQSCEALRLELELESGVRAHREVRHLPALAATPYISRVRPGRINAGLSLRRYRSLRRPLLP